MRTSKYNQNRPDSAPNAKESSLYYLQSRYYNPTWGRFLNADSFVSTGQGLLGNNIFAYCLNNPVNRSDSTGTVSLWYYLIVDHDMGFIHRTVQQHIKYHYRVTTEVTLSNYGRADVMHAGAVWEIKHAGQFPDTRIALAQAQAYTYVCVNEEVKCLGAANAFAGSFYIQCLDYSYFVEYTTPYAGVVLYSVIEVSNYNGEYYAAYIPNTIKKKTLCLPHL